ncbi:MAG: hypothetical protein ACRDS9_12275 [Pseudonocardiaceae bacterium]
MRNRAEEPANGVVEHPLLEGAVHLLSAHEVRHHGMTLVAVCGEPVDASEPPPALCTPDCHDEHRYCGACVREAIRWCAQPGAGEFPSELIIRASR